LVDALARSRRSTVRPDWRWTVRTTMRRSATHMIATAACLVLLATATWPLWRSRPAPEVYKTIVRTGVTSKPSPPGNAQGESATLIAQQPHPGPLLVGEGEGFKPVLVNYQTTEPAKPIVELPVDVEVPGASLRLQPDAVVRGKNSQRVRVLVPPGGMVVAAENVRFENIDFIWRHRAERITAPERIAIVEQRSRSVEFVGCTFQAAEAPPFGLPPAVRLRSGAAGSTTLPAACRVRLERCVLKEVAAAVDGAAAGPMAIELNDTLHTARGPLIRLAEYPAIDAPVAISLKHTTVRGTIRVIELGAGGSSFMPGAINIEAVACALALEPAGSLLAFTGSHLPKAAASGRMPIEWTGQGSLADADTVVAIWQHDGTCETLPDDGVPVEGLVPGKMEFAGLSGDDPATSRLTNWLAPLLSDESPGIGDSLPRLPPIK
jgi:hypothetical protein